MTYDPANPNNKPNPFRNLRPEMDPANIKHQAFVLLPEAYEDVRQRLINFNALHRLAFIAASMEHNGVFIDIRQESAADPVPYPENQGELVWCGIVGDRTVTALSVREVPNPGFKANFAVSKGPSAYHQQSLKALFRMVDVVHLDVTGTGNSAIYMAAAAPTAMFGKNTLLIETTMEMAQHWVHFVNEFAGQAKKVLIDDEATALAMLEAEAPQAGKLLN